MDLPTIEAFLQKHGSEDKQRFLARFADPFLLVGVSGARSAACEFGTVGGPAEDRKSTEFEAAARQTLARTVFALAKTNRNSFHNMITLGRASNNDVVVPHGSVSKFHAFFRKDPATNRVSVFDAGSTFGTTVNGKEVDAVAGRPLSSGDTLVFATVVVSNFFPPGDLHDYLQILKRLERTRAR